MPGDDDRHRRVSRARALALASVLTLLGLLACSASSDAPSKDTWDQNDASTSNDGAPFPSDAHDASRAADVSAASDAGEGDDVETKPPPVKTALQPLPVDGAYPRAIQRSDGTIVAVISAKQQSGNVGGTFFESTDEGLTFQEIGHIDDPGAGDGLYSAALYELPRALGSLPAKTLLWATSVGWLQTKAPMHVPIWSSLDGGRTWAPLSQIVASVVYTCCHGLWEPEFTMLDDGTLVCHISDETDPAHSQKLIEVRSSDGIHWSAPNDTVALSNGGFRPGMPTVRRGPSGVYFMSYEVCGDGCSVHIRSSNDGWNWGDPTDIGARPTTVDGKYFQHAPTLMWSSTPSQYGRFFLVGQVAVNADGSPSPENGNLILANAENANLFWYGIAAPAPVSPAPYDDSCPNYSSTLVPLDNGATALELSSRYDGKVCRTYYARGPLLGSGDATGVQSGSTFRLVNVQSGQCLDVAGGSSDPGARIEQWSCNGLAPQNWTFWQQANGAFSIKAQNSGMCLAPGKADGGPLLEQETCDGSVAQDWTARQVGLDYYEVVHSSGACLDNAGGSTTPGTNVQVWTCNDLSPQIWHLEAR